MQIWKIPIFLLSGKIWIEILLKYYTEVISKLNIFCLLLKKALERSGALRSTYEHFRAPMSTQEHLRALRSTNVYGAMAVSVLMTPWPRAHEWS